MHLITLIFAYFLGAVPFGLLVAQAFCNIDPRKDGSKNVGATNVGRLCGTGYGIFTLLLDLLKGLIPVLIAVQISDSAAYVSLVAFAALMGHCYSIFLHFTGGKAVATTIGVFLGLAPCQLLVCVILAVVLVLMTGYMSIGSLVISLCLPVLLLFSSKTAYVPLGIAVMLLIFWRHRANIMRLARGEEHTWKKKKSDGA